MGRPPKLYQYENLSWKNLPRKQVHIILQRSSAEKIINEWNLLFEKSYTKSIFVRSLIKRIERHLNK